VSEGLTRVSTSALARLRDGLRAGRLTAPLSSAGLLAFGVREQVEPLVAALSGHARASIIAVLEGVLAEREAAERPAPELVWTGPEGSHASARDTAVVLRELFESARSRVVLAGYSFRDARTVLGPLAEVMRVHGVEAHFFVDIAQPRQPPSEPESYGQTALTAFIEENWPFGRPYPELYCDRRALAPPPPWSRLHAKCVAVDGRRALVSSANFTKQGQDRNIETGVLLHDAAFASQLDRQWFSLVEGDLVFRWHATR